MPIVRRRSTCAGTRYGQATTRSGFSARMPSRLIAPASPTRARLAASGGQSAGASTPTTSSPAPAAKSSSVACGARLITRRAGATRVTFAPLASTATIAACAPPTATASNNSNVSARCIVLVTVTHAAEEIGAHGVVVGSQFVVPVEGVAEHGEQCPLFGPRVLGIEVDQRIAAHAQRVRGIVVARRRRHDLHTELQCAERLRHAQTA